MFQRLKGFNLDSFLDTKIAEEQARQRGGPSSQQKRTSSQQRKPSGRTGSPSKRPSAKGRDSDLDKVPAGKGPDPSEFLIEDDDELSRSTTPRPPEKDEDTPQVSNGEKPSPTEGQKSEDLAAQPEEKPKAAEVKSSGVVTEHDLPQEVQAKLRKLTKLESRYHDLLRSYRVAHARVAAIEPFEASLRESTPLTSINDPTALVEYLSQLGLKGDMVMDELKRVSGDKDSLKKDLDKSEEKLKEAYEEAAGLRKERDELKSGQAQGASKADPKGEGGDDFFSYESEVPRMQDELHESASKVEALTAENESLRKDLDQARSAHQKLAEELDVMSTKVKTGEDDERVTSNLEERLARSEKSASEVRSALDNALSEAGSDTIDSEPPSDTVRKLASLLSSAREATIAAQKRLEGSIQRSETAERTLKEHEDKLAALEQNTSDSNSSDKKRIQTLDELVKSMRTQLTEAGSIRQAAEKDLESMRKQFEEAEKSRSIAQSSSAETSSDELAGLRSQLGDAQRERDDAFQILIDSGIVQADQSNGHAEQVPAPTEGDKVLEAPSATAEASKTESGAAKKKNKKKKKKPAGEGAGPAETKDVEPDAKAETTPAQTLAETPPVASDKLSDVQRKAVLDAMGNLHSHASCEKTISELREKINAKEKDIDSLSAQIGEKETSIDRLSAKIKGEEDLQEEVEGLKDDLMHIGNDHVAAKDQVKTLRAEKQKAEDDHAANLQEVEQRCKSLEQKCGTLESEAKNKAAEQSRLQTELDMLKSSSGSSAKDLEEKLASVSSEKAGLEDRIKSHAKELLDLKSSGNAGKADFEKKQSALSKEIAEHKDTVKSLRTDLSAANELAQARFKDLTALRDHLNKVQPEMNNLKKETEELRKTNDSLKSGNNKLRELESRADELKSEIATHKSTIADKNTEISSLADKLKQSNDRASTLDEKERALTHAETLQKETADARDKAEKDLSKLRDDLKTTRTKLVDLEKQISTVREEASSSKEELQLKAAQQASAQSLMESMSDQTRELATQMKEVKERCESLEEELADAHRLLSERSREGETMRRLLADVEGRADSRIKEMRERLDLAVEERDRAEDSASAAGRRKARELEDLRTRLKEAEKSRTAAVELQEGFEKRERVFEEQRIALEKKAGLAQEELDQVRSAMQQLRDALDEGERQGRDLEKEKAELKRAVEDKEKRLEKLTKGSKGMAEELRNLQSQAATKARQPSVPSSRSSMESSWKIGSPVQNGSSANLATTGGPEGKPAMDYVYLKNVLLQFLEQKDKKHQMQLVPVLGMLLHFDRKDEQKWVTAINTK